MHRVIMDAPKGITVDHRDGNGLNNRRSNMRFATQSQQMMNKRRRHSKTSSKYKGVWWMKPYPKWRQAGRWVAELKFGKMRIRQYAKTDKEAARLYNTMARQHFGEYAKVNEGIEDAASF
jgi:hypothetical protein